MPLPLAGIYSISLGPLDEQRNDFLTARMDNFFLILEYLNK